MNITALINSNQEHFTGHIFLVANAIFCVVHDFLLTTAPSLVLTISCHRSSNCYFYRDVLAQFFLKCDKIEVFIQIVEVGNSSQEPVPGQRNRNLILIDSYQAFLDVDIISLTSKNNFNEYNYIILHTPHNLMQAQLQQILDYCWANQIIHCSVQVGGALGEVFVYTYFPFTANHCGKVVPVLINQYNGSAFVQPKLFPEKLQNMHGCPLRVATWSSPPFIYLFTHGNVTSISGGIEGQLLQTLASSLNFTVDLKILFYQEEHGHRIGNRVSNGLLMLQNRSADILLAAVHQSIERNQIISYTMSYYQSNQVFSVLDSTYNLTSWQILMIPFHINSWLLIIFTFVLALLKVALEKAIYKRCSPKLFVQYYPKYSYLNVFGTFVGMPALSIPKYTNARILLINWLFFALILRTLYQALLFNSIHTHVRNCLPDSIEELINSKLTAVMTLRSYEAVQEVTLLQRMPKLILHSSNHSNVFECIKKFDSKQYMALSPQEIIMLQSYSGKDNGDFKILPIYLIALPITMYMTDHSFLVDQFDEELLRISGAGFIDLWRRWELDDKIQKGTSHKEDEAKSLNELYMVFVLHGVGLLVAFLIFILELMAKKLNMLKNLFD